MTDPRPADPFLVARDYYRDRQQELLAGWKRTEGLGHNGLRGARREQLVREALAEFLPGGIGITRGEILGSTGQRSPELDVLLYDSVDGSVLFREGDISVLPAESVLAVLSVKTRLELGHIRELSEIAVRLRDFTLFPRFNARRAGDDGAASRAWPDDADPPPGMFVMARTGPQLDSVARELKASWRAARGLEFPTDALLNAVAILDRGVVTMAAPTVSGTQVTPFVRPLPGKTLVSFATETDGLGVLGMGLAYFLAFQPRTTPNMARYAMLGTMGLTPVFEPLD